MLVIAGALVGLSVEDLLCVRSGEDHSWSEMNGFGEGVEFVASPLWRWCKQLIITMIVAILHSHEAGVDNDDQRKRGMNDSWH